MRQLYFALDLRDDPALIEAYERWHRPENIWLHVAWALRARCAGELELFRCGNRLIQVVHVPPGLSPAVARPALAGANECLAEWEEFMWQFQMPLPFAKPGEKWVSMQRIFSLNQTLRDGASGMNGASYW